jgi:hypothetical protein
MGPGARISVKKRSQNKARFTFGMKSGNSKQLLNLKINPS